MTDSSDVQPQGDAPAATVETPAQPAATPAPADVESIVSNRLAEFSTKFEEERLKPLQRLISERDAEIQRLKTATMSEDEREQLRIEKEEQDRQSFETERWLFNKAKENAAAAELLERWLSTDDPDELYKFAVEIAARQAPATPTPAATPEPSEQVPDIDPNNPARSHVPQGTPVTADGQVLDKEFRKSFLQNLAHWPRDGA